MKHPFSKLLRASKSRPVIRHNKRTTPKDPVLCDFNAITLSVPRFRLIKLMFKQSYLDPEETIFLKALLWKTEAANNKILHVQSLCEKALLKAYSTK